MLFSASSSTSLVVPAPSTINGTSADLASFMAPGAGSILAGAGNDNKLLVGAAVNASTIVKLDAGDDSLILRTTFFLASSAVELEMTSSAAQSLLVTVE